MIRKAESIMKYGLHKSVWLKLLPTRGLYRCQNQSECDI